MNVTTRRSDEITLAPQNIICTKLYMQIISCVNMWSRGPNLWHHEISCGVTGENIKTSGASWRTTFTFPVSQICDTVSISPAHVTPPVLWRCLLVLRSLPVYWSVSCSVTQDGNRAWTCESLALSDSSTNAAGGALCLGAPQDRGSFKVILIFIFIQVQVAVWTGDLKEVSLCQTQLTGDVLP